MIVLDTNVLSELTRPDPNPDVVAWVDSLIASQVATTAISASELLYGVARLPKGRRKTALTEAVRSMLDDDLDGHVETFDYAAAKHYAIIVSEREKNGRPISVADAQIASICRKLKATLATRNIKDFDNTEIEIIDPWNIGGDSSSTTPPRSAL